MMCGSTFAAGSRIPTISPATQKRIIKKTVQGCKAACVEVPCDSVSVDVIRLETFPTYDP
jgi:hypothetical protein